MSDTSRIATDWKIRGRDLAVYAAIGLFMALINPFGSVSGSSFPIAAAYWVSLVVFGSFAGDAGKMLVDKLAPGLPAWGQVPIIATLVSIVILPSLLLVEWVLRGGTVAAKDLPRIFAFIWVISIAVTAVGVLIDRASRRPLVQPGSDDAGKAVAAPLLDRLPLRLRNADIYAIQAEDHYLRVHTSAGQEMILMRLSDALRELGNLEGLQTHRSWWVARQGIAEVSKEASKLQLKLKSGVAAPVSRTYQVAVRNAGWI